MVRQHYILLSVLIAVFFPCTAYSETIQHFDSRGNQVSITQTKTSYDARSLIRRYSLPEGIELRKDIKYEFYPVFGKTFSEAVRSTEENGPLNIKENKHYRSKFEWKFGWSYKFKYTQELNEESQPATELEEEGQYAQEFAETGKIVNVALDIYDINISYDISITLPTLLDDSALNPIEKSMWKNYLQKIIDYEYDHVKIVEDPATKEAIIKSIKDIDYIIFDYKEGVDIEKVAESFLKDETAKLGRYWASQIKIKYDEYDKTTNFGLKPEMRETFFKQK
jgi:predicted secreted Zn-dependent protease